MNCWKEARCVGDSMYLSGLARLSERYYIETIDVTVTSLTLAMSHFLFVRGLQDLLR